MEKKIPPIVFFNSSVILAGLASSSGGSAKLLQHVRKQVIIGVISELVLDEVLRHADKIRLTKVKVKRQVLNNFKIILPPPDRSSVEYYQHLMIDIGDAHLLASSRQIKAYSLVTLDKKHLLNLQDKIKNFRILSPKQLIETLSKKYYIC